MSVKINLLPRKTVRAATWKALNIIVGVSTVLQLSVIGALVKPAIAQAATTSLSTTILSWNTLGVDSNDPVTVGPHKFLLQARITNTGAAPATGVQTTFAWGSGTSYLSLVSTPTFPLNTIAPGASKDVFYVVQVTPPGSPNTPSNDVFDKTRAFTITASSPDASNAPAGQTLLIEHILSQSRNHILSSTVTPSNPLVGQPFTVHVEYETASTYLDITPQMTYNPAAVTLDSVVTNYITDGGSETDIYSQNHGNIVHSDFHFRAQSAGNLNFFYTVLDHSGSSFHYNADFSNAIIVPVQPRQALTKTVDKITANAGDALTYTLNYANLGNIDLANVVITETYDSHFTFSNSTPVPSSGNNVWNIGTLVVGASGTITIHGTLTGSFGNGTTTVHNVAVMTTTTPNVDPITATADTRVTAACLLNITKSVDKATANPGDVLTYTLNYQNTGTADCTGGGVRVNDTVPAGITYNGTHTQTSGTDYGYGSAKFGIANPTGYDSGSRLLSWNANVLTPGESGTVTWQATVNTPTQCGPYDIPNFGKIYSNEVPNGVTSNTVHTTGLIPCAGTLTVIKHVINDNGGTKVASDFAMHVSNGSPATFAGSEAGTVVTVAAGASFSVTEDAVAGYAASTSGTCSGTMTSGASLTCTVTNNDIQPKLTVTKVVINDNGGTKQIVDFPLFVSGGPVTSGVQNGFNAGGYTVSETNLPGYASAITGDCATNGNVTLNIGDVKSCTITNNDIQPKLTVTKIVINDDGGNNQVGDFPLFVDQTGVVSGVQNGFNAGAHAISETNLPGYTATISGDCNAQGQITLGLGDVKSCTITNDDVAPSITLIKSVTNNNGGTAGINDFGLTIGGVGVNSGDTKNVSANTPIALNEAGRFGYNFVSLTGDAKCPSVLGGTVTLNEGENVTCTITNDDIAPRLIVYKHVINDNTGGTATADDFTLRVTGQSPSPASFPGDEAGTTVTLGQGAYGVSEDAFPGYTATYSTDCTGTINVGETKYCTVSNAAQAAHLIVIKSVINNNGGNNVAGDFNMVITGVTAVGGNSFPGQVDPGTDRIVHPGHFVVTETPFAGYSVSYNGCEGDIALGETKICTVTNDDIAPTITLNKTVIKDNGGTAGNNDFGLTIGGTPVNSGQTLNVTANTPIALNEVGLFGYNFVSLTGDPKCPSVLNGTVTLNEDEHITCVITNNDIAPQLTVIKHVINDNGGTAVAAGFTMNVTGTNVSTPTFAGVEDPGTTITLNQGNYSVLEGDHDGYTMSWSGDCADTIAVGQHKTCTIINDDQQATVTVIKQVINDNGGTKVASDFTIDVTSPTVNTSITGAVDPGTTINLNPGPYTVAEDAGLGYRSSMIGDCESSIALGQHKTCTVINDDVAASVNIQKTDSPDPVQAGGIITYTIEWSLGSEGYAKNLIITDPIPANTTYVPNSADCGVTTDKPTTGTCTIDDTTNTLMWSIGDRAANESGKLTFRVQVASPMYNGSLIYNTACVNQGVGQELSVASLQSQEPICSSTTTTVQSDFVVTIDKSDTPDPVQAGGNLTYTLNWSVSGNAPITSVIITDPLPANTTFVSADNGGVNNAGIVTWDLGPQVSGANGVLTLVVKVASPIANGTVLTNTGKICGQSRSLLNDVRTDVFIPAPPVIEHCAEDSTTTTVQSAPSISITKANNVVGFTNPGKTVTYTVTVSNAASATDSARDVVMNDLLPTGFVYNDGGGVTKNFPLGTIAPGASVTTIFTATIDAGQLAGTYTNTASAQGSNTAKVSATSDVVIRVPAVFGAVTSPNLTIEKSVKPTTTNPGKVVTYTVTVKNIGDGDATNVVVRDTLPDGFTFVEGGKSTISWNLGTIAPNHTRIINYEVRVGANVKAGSYKNVAVLTADGLDPLVAQAKVTVIVPKVLGLATTGVGLRDYLIFGLGLSLAGLGLFWTIRQRRSNYGTKQS